MQSRLVLSSVGHGIRFFLYEPLSKLLISPLVTPTVVPYIIPYITPFKEFRHGVVLGGCQNYGPFLGTLNIRCRIIIRDPKKHRNFDNHLMFVYIRPHLSTSFLVVEPSKIIFPI